MRGVCEGKECFCDPLAKLVHARWLFCVVFLRVGVSPCVLCVLCVLRRKGDVVFIIS